MIFAKDLLIKGAAGLALCAGVGAGGWYVITQNKGETLQSLAEKVGLSCTGDPTGTTGAQCTKKDGSENIKVKKGNEENSTFDVTSLPTSGTPAATIKAYKVGSPEEYNKGFKFVIEGGDITGTNSKKLEQFETYEIKEEGGEWLLIRKTKVIDKIEKDLGLKEAECTLPTTTEPKVCENLDTTKFGVIKFHEKTASSVGGSVKLTINKLASADEDFPYEHKFTFEAITSDATITTSSETITLKTSIPREFKIKKGNDNSFSLEKAWTVKSLAAKVGLVCPEEAGTEGECTLNENGINVNNEESSKFTNASRGANNDQKKVKFEVNKENFNQGFKFFVDESADICLDSGTDKKIEKKGDSTPHVFYEVKKSTGSDTNWYLTKKSS